jgi:hypothetical protein
MSKIVMTPINLVSKSLTSDGKKAKTDYLREKDFERNGQNAKWDDSKHNKAMIGDYFAFVHNAENRAEIYKIEKITLAETRPDYWDMPEHQQRNVLHLSSMIKEISFDELRTLAGYKETWNKVQGTMRSSKSIIL